MSDHEDLVKRLDALAKARGLELLCDARNTTEFQAARAIESLLAEKASARALESERAAVVLSNLWNDATNAVCQRMQDDGCCTCANGMCLAATVDPHESDIAIALAELRALRSPAKEKADA